MLKKITLSIYFILASASSLLALNEGSFIFYPQIGFGRSDADVTAYSGDELNDLLVLVPGGPWAYKDPKVNEGYSWSAGLEVDYMITDFLALTGGIFLDWASYKVVYESPSNHDSWMKFNLLYLGAPVALRLYYSSWMTGCGLYFSYPFWLSASSEFTGLSNKGRIHGALTTVGFFMDHGLNFDISDANNLMNLMIFMRVKSTLHSLIKETT
jgi:hypothetical protein